MNKQTSLLAVLGLICTLGVTPTVLAGDDVITFYENAFLPTFVSVTVGEPITFLYDDDPDNVDHVVTIEGPGDELFEFTLDADNTEHTIAFAVAGLYSVSDPESVFEGTIDIEPYEYEVEVIDSSFEPEHTYLFEGDQVFWHYNDMLLHTVTNGEDLDDPELGELFDETVPALTAWEFTYIFESGTGVVPYFCIPHLLINMTGTVTVQKRFIRGDANGDGVLDIADPINLLEYIYLDGDEPTCLDAYDCDDNGTVEIDDVFALLDALYDESAPDLPAPFPLPGADRTDDTDDSDPANDNFCL